MQLTFSSLNKRKKKQSAVNLTLKVVFLQKPQGYCLRTPPKKPRIHPSDTMAMQTTRRVSHRHEATTRCPNAAPFSKKPQPRSLDQQKSCDRLDVIPKDACSTRVVKCQEERRTIGMHMHCQLVGVRLSIICRSGRLPQPSCNRRQLL
jgi:hypothetical protein